MIPPPGCRGDTTTHGHLGRRGRGEWWVLTAFAVTRRGSRPPAGHSWVGG